jgi:hypothetical protein
LTFSISDPVTFEFTPSFFTLRLDDEPFRLRDSKLCPTLGRALPILQTCGSLSGDPEVDDFRHVNERRYPDMPGGSGLTPLIKVNYADTVTLDHSGTDEAPVLACGLPGIGREVARYGFRRFSESEMMEKFH